MNSHGIRYYTVVASRLMVGGRLFAKGDTVSGSDVANFSAVLRSGALVPLPFGIQATVAVGIPLDLDEPRPNEIEFGMPK